MLLRENIKLCFHQKLYMTLMSAPPISTPLTPPPTSFPSPPPVCLNNENAYDEYRWEALNRDLFECLTKLL